MSIESGRYDAHHPVFTPLDDDALLWRFIDLPKLISLLEYRALHFARVDTLDDPFEGELSDPGWVFRGLTVDEQGKYSDIRVLSPDYDWDAHEIAYRRYERRNTSVCCWNHSDFELEALWGRYSSMGAGLALRSTFGRLTRSFGEPFAAGEDKSGQIIVYVGKVHYVDYATAVWPADNAYWPFVHKRLSFAPDGEVRALISRGPMEEPGIDLENDESAPSRLLSVDVESLIEAITVSPKAPEWFVELVRDVVARYGLDVPVARSIISEPPRRDLSGIRAIDLLPDDRKA